MKRPYCLFLLLIFACAHVLAQQINLSDPVILGHGRNPMVTVDGDIVHLVWQRWGVGKNLPYVRSTDGGLSFSETKELSPTMTGVNFKGKPMVVGGLAFIPFASYMNSHVTLYGALSTDRGETWQVEDMPLGFSQGEIVSNHSNGELMAMIHGYGGVYHLLLSEDGSTWSSVLLPQRFTKVRVEAGTITLVNEEEGRAYYTDISERYYITSSNNGNSWSSRVYFPHERAVNVPYFWEFYLQGGSNAVCLDVSRYHNEPHSSLAIWKELGVGKWSLVESQKPYTLLKSNQTRPPAFAEKEGKYVAVCAWGSRLAASVTSNLMFTRWDTAVFNTYAIDWSRVDLSKEVVHIALSLWEDSVAYVRGPFSTSSAIVEYQGLKFTLDGNFLELNSSDSVEVTVLTDGPFKSPVRGGGKGTIAIPLTLAEDGNLDGNFDVYHSGASLNPMSISLNSGQTQWYSTSVGGQGWSLVSMPIVPKPGSEILRGYGYLTSGYSVMTIDKSGRGCWFKGEQSVELQGIPLDSVSVALEEGWNLIGGPAKPVPTAAIVGPMSTSSFFGYDGQRYVAVDTLQPGQGYWVRASSAGEIIISAKPQAGQTIKIGRTDEVPPIPPEIEANLPEQFQLEAYPNPFNPSTTIRFSLPERANVTLNVFNLIGEKIATLIAGEKEAGEYVVKWSAQDLPSGVYLVRLSANRTVRTVKLSLMK